MTWVLRVSILKIGTKFSTHSVRMLAWCVSRSSALSWVVSESAVSLYRFKWKANVQNSKGREINSTDMLFESNTSNESSSNPFSNLMYNSSLRRACFNRLVINLAIPPLLTGSDSRVRPLFLCCDPVRPDVVVGLRSECAMGLDEQRSVFHRLGVRSEILRKRRHTTPMGT